MPIRMQVPQAANSNLGSSFIGGIKSGEDYARAKAMADYRGQELQRQYSQMENSMAEHKLKIMEKSFGAWRQIATTDPAKRGPLIKFQQNQDSMMGINSSGLAILAKDPDFMIDTIQPGQQLLQGLKNQDPKAIMQGFNDYKAAAADPMTMKDIISQVGSVNRQQNNLDFQNKKLDASTTKQEGQDLKSFSLKMRSDPGYRKAEGMANKLPTILKSIDEAGKDPVLAGNMGLLLANYATNNQRLNQVEISGLGKGSQAIVDRLQQYAQKLISGTTSDVNLKGMKNLANILGHGAKDDLQSIEKDYAGAYAQQSGKPLEEAYTKLTNKPYPSEAQGQKDAAIVAPTLPQEHIEKISSKVKELSDSKMAPDEIKKHLMGKFPGLNDADLKAIGLPQSTPSADMPMPDTSTPTGAKSEGMQQERDKSSSGAQTIFPEAQPVQPEQPAQEENQ